MIQLAGDHIDLTDYLLNLLVQGAEDIQRGTQLLVLLMDLAYHTVHDLYTLIGVADQVLYDATDLVCGFPGLVCQTTDFFGYDCKTSAHLAGSRCLNTGI